MQEAKPMNSAEGSNAALASDLINGFALTTARTAHRRMECQPVCIESGVIAAQHDLQVSPTVLGWCHRLAFFRDG